MWESSTWHYAARTIQLLGTLTSTGFHGFVTSWVHKKKLGLSRNMVVLQLLITALFLYTIFAIILQKKKKGSKKSNWLVILVVFDVICCGALLGIITLLAHAGLPIHCAGMTRNDYRPKDAPPIDPSNPKFSTNRFSDEIGPKRGGLDGFCNYERTYFYVANALVFTYIITIVIAMVRIVEQRMSKSSKFNTDDEEINLKELDAVVPSPLESISPNRVDPLSQQNLAQHSPPAPASEGIITRSNSLRSTFTAATTSTRSGPSGARPTSTSSCGPYRTNTIPRRPVGFGQHSTAAPFQGRVPQPSAGFSPIPLDDDSAEAALVSDGMRPPGLQSQPLPQLQPQPQSQSQPLQSHHYRQQSRDHGAQYQQFPRMPMLLEEDQMSISTERTDADAQHALVSDGMRPSAPMLPPYEPGRNQMPGHGEGDSEGMRLSGYGKGGR